jgi:hypothetical protein
VISSKETLTDGREAFRTHVFAYVPAHSKKRMLLLSTQRRGGIADGLNTLLIMLREKLSECVSSCGEFPCFPVYVLGWYLVVCVFADSGLLGV